MRQLAGHYRNSASIEVGKQAATQILQALHTHSRREENVFYPGVRNVDPGLIGHFEQQHGKTDKLLATLQGMSMDGPRSDRMMRELLDMSMHHIQEEEEQFFPKLEQAQIDLAPIGLEMAAFEANLVHMQAQASDAPGAFPTGDSVRQQTPAFRSLPARVCEAADGEELAIDRALYGVGMPTLRRTRAAGCRVT